MQQLTHLAQTVADLHATADATGEGALAGRLGATLARLETMADPYDGVARDGFDRERILDTVADLARTADRHEQTRPVAAWLRGVLAACGRPVDGPTVDLGDDATPYAGASAAPDGWYVRVDVSGVDAALAPTALALALAAELPDVALTGVAEADAAAGRTTLVAAVTGHGLASADRPVDTHVDVAGRRTHVTVAALAPASVGTLDDAVALLG